MTKAERKEDARREREDLQRRIVRRRRHRRLTLGAALIAGVAIAVGALLVNRSGGQPAPADLLKVAKSEEKAAGCTAVQTEPPFDPQHATGTVPTNPDAQAGIDFDHVPSQYDPTYPKLSDYPSVPPASGPHAPIPPGPVPAGVYDSPPDVYRVIHDLEHGAAVVWYSPASASGDVQKIRDFYDQSATEENVGQDRVVVAPYDYPDQGPAGQLPSGVHMALVAWHRLETCAQVNLAAAFDFTSQYSASRTAAGQVVGGYPGRKYVGDAREAGAVL
jgi:hypothetical protein